MKRFATILACALAACSDAGSDALNVGNFEADNAATEVTPPPKPEHRYADRDGDVYFYIMALSEEDKKKGKAAGGVVGFRYIGETNDVYRLQDAIPYGAINACSNPCKVIKTTRHDGGIERVEFNPDSIIGAAFTDAFNGYLTPAGASKRTASLNVAPSPPTDLSSDRSPTYAGGDLPVGNNEPYFNVTSLTAAQRGEVENRCSNGNRDSCTLLENEPQ